MIVPLGALLAGLLRQPADSVRICVRDAVSSAPVVGATVRYGDGTTLLWHGDCRDVPRHAMPMLVARIGYGPRQVSFDPASARGGPGADTLFVWLTPRAQERMAGDRPARLAVQRITASTAPSARAGTVQATLGAADARERGVTTMNGLVTLLPYTAVRSSRGESGVSLRGARREQVVVTLDGLPLNDPATGLADVSDLPLVAVQSASVLLGADPMGAGNGASGGVLALTTASQRLAQLRSGAFGLRAAEGAWAGAVAHTRLHGAVSHTRAANDFRFRNDAGEAATFERRVNNDESRTVVALGVVAGRTQWMTLVSAGERGMVGPANVRAYDDDRSRTARVLVRGQSALGSTVLATGFRHFALAYRNPVSPVLDTRASAWAGDVEWRGAAPVGRWRLGTGADGLTGSGNVRQQRVRGFAAWAWQHDAADARRLAVDAGVRADAVEGSGVQPTGALGVKWRTLGTPVGPSLALVARAAQAVRVPTLYDLYFSSPQRLSVRALDPERVAYDVNAGVQGQWQRARWRVLAEGTLVARETRDAIVWFPGNFGWSPANVGRERLQGTEVRATLAHPALSVGAWHTWYHARLQSGRLDIPTPYVPSHSAAVNGVWHVRGHALSLAVRHQGRRPFTAGPRDVRFELPAVTVTDVAWSRHHTLSPLHVQWSVALENVTDVRWQSVRGFPMPGRGWSAALTLSPRS